MRPTVLPLIVFCSIFATASQLSGQTDTTRMPPASQTQPNQPGHVEAPTTSLQDSSGAPGDTGQQMKDKMFLREATEGGLAEIELGKLAVEKGESSEVKEFGQKMVEEHTKLNADLAEVADSIGMMLPKKMGKDDKAEYDKLSALSGEEFDKEYIAYMMKDHHKNLHEFRIASNTTSETALRTAADNGARMIRQHMILVDRMAHERGITMPGRGPRPTAPSQTTPPTQ